MNQGVFISLDYGTSFKNIVDVLNPRYDSTIETGSISVSGDGYKMIISVYQNSSFPLYICTMNDMLLSNITEYDVNLPIDTLSCGNSLVIFNTYSNTIGESSAGTYFASFIDTTLKPSPPPTPMPSGYNTPYNVVQQSCKMRYAQNIRHNSIRLKVII